MLSKLPRTGGRPAWVSAEIRPSSTDISTDHNVIWLADAPGSFTFRLKEIRDIKEALNLTLCS
jgi:hypothetical protein